MPKQLHYQPKTKVIGKSTIVNAAISNQINIHMPKILDKDKDKGFNAEVSYDFKTSDNDTEKKTFTETIQGRLETR